MDKKDKKSTEAQLRANAKYDSKTAKKFGLKFNIYTDADILDRLASVDNFQGYIKSLIRADIESRDSKS